MSAPAPAWPDSTTVTSADDPLTVAVFVPEPPGTWPAPMVQVTQYVDSGPLHGGHIAAENTCVFFTELDPRGPMTALQLSAHAASGLLNDSVSVMASPYLHQIPGAGVSLSLNPTPCSLLTAGGIMLSASVC